MRLRAQVVRWVDDEPQPGWIEVRFRTVDGGGVVLFDKPPVFLADDDLGPASRYPVDLHLDCSLVAEQDDRVEVELLHGVQDAGGRARFTVRRADLTDG